MSTKATPGSDEYAREFWSSPEGKALYPTLFGKAAPPPPDPRERMAAALERHDKALTRWSRMPLGSPKPAGILDDEQLANMQDAFRVLDGDPLFGRADAASNAGWTPSVEGIEE